MLELPAIAQQGDDVLLVHPARKYQAPPRLEREQEQRRSGRSERCQAGGGAPARRVGEALDAAEVVEEVVAGL